MNLDANTLLLAVAFGASLLYLFAPHDILEKTLSVPPEDKKWNKTIGILIVLWVAAKLVATRTNPPFSMSPKTVSVIASFATFLSGILVGMLVVLLRENRDRKRNRLKK